MREIDEIIVHCADTYKRMDVGVRDIRAWHTVPPPDGRGWSDVGYHYVICRDSRVEEGRPLSRPGAHTIGKNANSIGICLVGGKGDSGGADFNFTRRQMAALEKLIYDLLLDYPGATISGHRDYANKPCPSFDVKAWWYNT